MSRRHRDAVGHLGGGDYGVVFGPGARMPASVTVYPLALTVTSLLSEAPHTATARPARGR